MTHLVLKCILMLLLVPLVASVGVFEFKVRQFSTSHYVCGKSRDCQIFFRICLKDVIATNSTCTNKARHTYVFHGDQSSISNNSTPIQLPFYRKWTGMFMLIIEAWIPDYSIGNQDILLTRLLTGGRVASGEEWSQDVQFGEQSKLSYSLRVSCDNNYYGNACSGYCKPRDDTFGHYTCGEIGNRVCLTEWKGEYCSEPICSSDCSEKHGYCEVPGECKCRLGWQGPSCSECARYPGCLHGTCTQPWQCVCKEGWGGLFCNQDLNYCTNHRPCANGTTCTNTGQGSYTCACRPRYGGTNCELEISECDCNPCTNGATCISAGKGTYTCACGPGYRGANCELEISECDCNPCTNGGTCISAGKGTYTCTCGPGYRGANCELDWK